MTLAVISFTRDGSRLLCRLCEALRARGYAAEGFLPPALLPEFPGMRTWGASAPAWTREQFARADGLIFIGAAGIAVRLIAPHLKDKFSDPAVVVVDDQANHVISLLSGHAGGANRLTLELAALLKADPVITTATDLRGKTAVDVWAKEHGLLITDRTLAKQAAQAVADGVQVGVSLDEELASSFQEAVDSLIRGNGQSYVSGTVDGVNVRITVRAGMQDVPPGAKTLRLVPAALVLGIGCRKHVPEKTLGAAVKQALASRELAPEAVAAVASIDLKRQETGLLELGRLLGVPVLFFSCDALAALRGDFAESGFVQSVTGVGNVCERAAVCGALKLLGREDGEGWQEHAALVLRKTAANGVTVAAALVR